MSSTAMPIPARHTGGTSPRPVRHLPSLHRRQPTPWAVILAVLLCFVSHTLAAALDPAAPVETVIIDDQTPPSQEGQRWNVLPEQEIRGLRMRGQHTTESPESTESSQPSRTSEGGSVTTTFSIAVGTLIPTSTSTTASASPLPSILDSLASNFTAGPDGQPAPCPIFINNFLNDPTFKKCYPLSMLFDNSKSFFQAQRTPVSITRTLDATCAANVTLCNDYMQQLAQNLTKPENCGADFEREQPAVVDAYLAMAAYAPVYSAGCLKDPDTGAYCYANAVTNGTNYSTTYFYFLPLNRTLPGSTVPACGDCLQQTMAQFQAATADRRQMIARTYVEAAKQVNTICGPGFVNESLAAEVIPASGAVSGRVAMRSSTLWVATGLAVVVGGVVWGL
ncbi:uncharacterized protein B0T15DRAFT_496889 [Chaetomium strumarium]|uniref:DUF7729 domain-containing protein n=1 Tax=Chaetomium strumarium TaxID=1170767 RepID=A0AAJ0GMG5_9PEZI|nr:hypothetical protein B0T15DRAFT_496889 [Chaetomium strumarium]